MFDPISHRASWAALASFLVRQVTGIARCCVIGEETKSSLTSHLLMAKGVIEVIERVENQEYVDLPYQPDMFVLDDGRCDGDPVEHVLSLLEAIHDQPVPVHQIWEIFERCHSIMAYDLREEDG